MNCLGRGKEPNQLPSLLFPVSSMRSSVKKSETFLKDKILQLPGELLLADFDNYDLVFVAILERFAQHGSRAEYIEFNLSFIFANIFLGYL